MSRMQDHFYCKHVCLFITNLLKRLKQSQNMLSILCQPYIESLSPTLNEYRPVHETVQNINTYAVRTRFNNFTNLL